MAEKVMIGWREYVAFPEWGIARIRAKTDTGARTSAIDVSALEWTGPDRVRFQVVTSNKSRHRPREVEARVTRRSRVRSSNGKSEDRIFVEAWMELGGVRKKIEVGLVGRENMLCRMLLGRSALGPDFLIDPHRKYLQKEASA